jgi:SAM-dependent methyltransferase
MDKSFESVVCNLCGGNRSRVLFQRPYAADILSEPGVFSATTDEYSGYGTIVRCLDCGLVYTNPRPTAAALLAGYAECVDDLYLAESSSRSINAHFSLNAIKRFVKSGKLIEIGSATGYFLNAARTDFDVEGIEPSEQACRIAREKFRLDCRLGAFETAPIPPASADVVAMIDVIEHLGDPKAALRRAADVLRPGGILYLVTPDIDSLSARLLRGYWWGLRPAHIYYFDGRTLGRMLEEAGFEVVLSKSFGRIFTWGYWRSRLRHYPRFIYGALRAAIHGLGIEDKFLYLDTRDSIEICARKR